MTVSTRTAQKNIDRHEFHGAGPVPWPTRATVKLFRQFQANEHASRVWYMFRIPDDEVDFRDMAVKYPSVVVQRSMRLNVPTRLEQFFRRGKLLNIPCPGGDTTRQEGIQLPNESVCPTSGVMRLFASGGGGGRIRIAIIKLQVKPAFGESSFPAGEQNLHCIPSISAQMTLGRVNRFELMNGNCVRSVGEAAWFRNNIIDMFPELLVGFRARTASRSGLTPT